MASLKNVIQVDLEKLIPYARNAKKHNENQVTRLAASIREFGFINPVLIDQEYNIIAGHGRVMAAKKLGLSQVPCLFIEGLSEAQRKAYILADNRLSEIAGWDTDMVTTELEELQSMGFDIDLTAFELESVTADWFKDHERNDTTRQEGNAEYNEFLDKFEDKKTTDDCYTPDNIYEAVADWVAKEYGLNKSDFVRPFYPGGDFEKENYSGKIVVDNPPFSFLSEIEKWFVEHGVKFFLFAPSVSCFPSKQRCTAICVGVGITYENGAQVNTSFVTNLEPELAARSAPDLYKSIKAANDENTKGKEFPKIEYPNNLVTASKIAYLSKYGQDFRLKFSDSTPKIGKLDEQKNDGIFGGGFLISEKAAAEKAAAEKAAAEKAAAKVWSLSDREIQIIKSLGDIQTDGE